MSQLEQLQLPEGVRDNADDMHAEIGLILHSLFANEPLETASLRAIASHVLSTLPVPGSSPILDPCATSNKIPVIDIAARALCEQYACTLNAYLK